MELALSFPFSLGMVAAFNPCGFAMLPTYLSYFLGLESGDETADDPAALLRNVVRALIVGAVLTLGFMAVFGTVGLLVETVVNQGTIFERVPYFTVAFGVLVIPLGIAMLFGFNPVLRLPKMNKGTGSRELPSIFMFGVSYAVVSLSCTAPLFLTQVVGSFTDSSTTTGGVVESRSYLERVVEGSTSFLAYGAGMGAVILFLTLSLAMARSNVARNLRQVLPWVNRGSGVLLVLAGVYLIIYGVWEIQVLNGDINENRLVTQFESLQANVSNWITDTTPQRLGLVALFGITGALLAGWRALEPDPVKRRSVTASWVLAYVVVELGFNRGEFILLPLARLVAGWPARIGHWFTDPARWGVPIEVAVTALVVWIIGRLVRRAALRPTQTLTPTSA